MRILFLDQFSDLGGAQRCLVALFPAPAEPGLEAHAALPANGPLPEMLEGRGVFVHRLSLGNYTLGRKGLSDLARWLRETPVLEGEIRSLVKRLDPAAIYVNGPRLMPAAARAARGRPVVFHSHNALTARNGRWLVSRALDRASASVVAASMHLAHRWRRPARVIYGGVAGPPQGWSRPPGQAGPRVGLVGRFAREKGQKEFVMAAASLAGEFPHARFLLCGDAIFGDGAGQRYQRELLGGLPPNVQHTGWRDDVYEVLKEMDLLVVPSVEEGGIPTVVLEAFAAFVPVLATPVGGIPEVVRDGQNGFLLQSHAAPVIAGRLRELLPQRDLLASVAEKAHRQWQSMFTARRYRSEVWDAILAQVLTRPRGPAVMRHEGGFGRNQTNMQAVDEIVAGGKECCG